MTFHVPQGEPQAGPWRPASLADLLQILGVDARPRPGRAHVVAVDGRSASGKTTLAARLAAAIPSSVLVHTDDLAWHEPFFGWSHLLRAVLEGVYSGQSVSLRPPAWVARHRAGSIEVPGDAALVVVEGVGASQREVSHLVDASVWVQSDFVEAERRGVERDLAHGLNGTEGETVAFWHEWMRHELAFLDRDRPWERATVVVAGSPVLPLAEDEVAIADTLAGSD